MSAGTKGIMKHKPNGTKKANKSNSNTRGRHRDEDESSVSKQKETKSRKSEVTINSDNEYYEDEYYEGDSSDERNESFYLHGGTDSRTDCEYPEDPYREAPDTEVLNTEVPANTQQRAGADPWSTEEKVPRHIKSLRNFLDKPKSQDEKKKTIKSRAAAEYLPGKREEVPPPIVFETRTNNLGNLAYFNASNKDESLQQVSMRRKSWTRDKKIAANMYNARLRLKCYTDERKKPVQKKKVPPPQPLVIPAAYAQLFIREYGNNYATLEEASIDYHRKRSASRENRRDSEDGEGRIGSKSACDTRPSSRRIPKKVSYEYDAEDDAEETGSRRGSRSTTRSISNLRNQHERNKLTSQKIRAALFD